MTSGLVNASFSLPEGQAVKMIFFAPWYLYIAFTWRHDSHFGEQNNETVAVMVYQKIPVGLNSSCVNIFVSSNLHSCWTYEWKGSINLHYVDPNLISVGAKFYMSLQGLGCRQFPAILGQTSPTVTGVPLLIRTIQPDQFTVELLLWYTSIQETSPIRVKGHFFWVRKTGFLFPFSNTLAFKKWLTTKRVDIFKCTLITIMEAFTNWTISLI